MKNTKVVEIAVEVTDAQLKRLLAFLKMSRIPRYVEPTNPAFTCLEDVECACEGK